MVAMRKVIVLIFFVIVMASISTGPAFAGIWSDTKYWNSWDGGAQGSYSPDWGYARMYEFYDEGVCKVSSWANFNYNQTTINAILYDYNQWYGFCPTIDISAPESDTNLTAYWAYCTLPDSVTEWEDDPEPWGNGYYDETEATCCAPWDIKVAEYENYYYQGNFRVVHRNGTRTEWTSQMSYWEEINHQWDTARLGATTLTDCLLEKPDGTRDFINYPFYGSAWGSDMRRNEMLEPGRYLESDDGRFKLVFQTDGNLVLYRNRDGRPLWHSRTAGMRTGFVIMQGDGNVVVYDTDRNARWSSGTQGNVNSWLQVQNDGNVVIYNSNNVPLWDTETYGQY